MAKRVIIYQDGLLSYSETFIKKQAEALKQWQPVLVGHKYQKAGLILEPLPHQLLIPVGTSRLRRAIYSVRRWLNIADPIGLNTLKTIQPDLIHVHFGTSAVDLWPYIRALKIPTLVTLHGFDISIYPDYWRAGKRGKRKKKYPDRLLEMARCQHVNFIAVSTDIKRRALEFGIPEEKIIVRFIGVDTHDFTPGPTPLRKRENKILHVGRLVEKKGADILLKAFKQVKQSVPDAELIIIGKGRLEAQLKEYVESFNIQGVSFLGAQPSTEVKRQLDQCKVFCLPSIRATSGDAEGLPISILEAQASGVLVASSSIGGMGDNLINNQTCFTFAEKDEQALATILSDALTNTDHYAHIVERQLDMINTTFRLEDCSRALEETYTEYSN